MSTSLRQARAITAPNGHVYRVARTHSLTGFSILGSGSYVPDPVVTNDDLARNLGFDSDWIIQRTGIRERRHAPPEMATSDLCYEAVLRCLDNAGATLDEVDMLVVGTFTPDMAFPSTACLLQNRLGLFCGAFDVQAACAGFMYALVVGAQFVRSGNARRCLVVGGDCNSRVINPGDIKSYPLFGDGAGAVLLGPGAEDQGLLSYQLGADGSGGDLLSRPAGGSRTPPSHAAIDADLHYLQMDGRAVFRWAVNMVTDSSTEVLEYAGLTADDVRLFVPHQANIRIINAVSDVLGFPRDRVFNNLDRYGNTSAGSVPLALDEARQAGRIDPGDLVLLSGFGAGLTWGTAVLRW
ncbi:MAG: beta-ketoacyl-ACP synthase III [Planctomycetia bacterium]